MFLLDWRLALFSLALLPFFVWLTRRVGRSAAASPPCARAGSPTSRRSSRSRCRSRASCSARRWAARPELAERFERRVRAASPTSRSARGWPGAGAWRRCRSASRPCRRSSTWFAGLSDRRRRRSDHDRHAGRLHDAADAALLPDPVAALGRRRRPELAARCSSASSSTSTCRSRSRSATVRAVARQRARPRRGRASRASASATSPTAAWTLRDIDLESRPGRRPRWSARPARARRRSPTCSRASTTSSGAR